jgi:multidrug efflux system membrane fusion protein
MSDPHSPTALDNAAPPKKDAPPPPAQQQQHPSGEGKRSVWPWIIVLLITGAGGYYYYENYWKPAPAGEAGKGQPEGGGGQGQGKAGGGGRRGRGGGATPVVAVKAHRGNIGVYYTNTGSVTPIYTVTVKSRVDGQLMALHYKEGDLVKQGDLLAEIDPRPFQAQLTQYEGQLLRDQALLDNAKVDQSRYETLLKQNAIPEQQLATQKSVVKQNEGVVKQDEGLIDAVKLNLVYCKIMAPITGRVGLRLVDPGNIIHASDTNGLLVITQLQPISAIFPVVEDQLNSVLPKLNAGQKLPVDAYDRDMNKKLATGVLSTTDNVIDQTTGTLKLRAIFDNSHNELFPNQFINARLLVQMKTGVILMPTAAIQRNTDMTYVWNVKPDSSVTIKKITIGTTEGDLSEITSGLVDGDVVVMTGVDKLLEGAKVNVSYEGAGAKKSNGSAPGGGDQKKGDRGDKSKGKQ